MQLEILKKILFILNDCVPNSEEPLLQKPNNCTMQVKNLQLLRHEVVWDLNGMNPEKIQD